MNDNIHPIFKEILERAGTRPVPDETDLEAEKIVVYAQGWVRWKNYSLPQKEHWTIQQALQLLFDTKFADIPESVAEKVWELL